MNACQLWELKTTRPLPVLILLWQEIYALMQPRQQLRISLPWQRRKCVSHLNARQIFTRLQSPSRSSHKIGHDLCFAPVRAKRRVSP
jgi:hypothetical protein